MTAPYSDAGGHGRQAATSLDHVSPDHLQRYLWAAHLVSSIRLPASGVYYPRPRIVVDAGCGVGYGSWIMAEGIAATDGVGIICGFDIEPSAIDHAEKHWPHRHIEYTCGDAAKFFSESHIEPDIVVAFEVIEHIVDPGEFLSLFRDSGARMLLASVPNELEYPFVGPGGNRDRPAGHRPAGHVRHYTPADFESLLLETGWRPVGRFGQDSKKAPAVRPGWVGRTILAVAVPV